MPGTPASYCLPSQLVPWLASDSPVLLCSQEVPTFCKECGISLKLTTPNSLSPTCCYSRTVQYPTYQQIKSWGGVGEMQLPCPDKIQQLAVGS